MLLPSAVLVALLASVPNYALATLDARSPAGQTMQLVRKAPFERTEEEWGIWAKIHRLGLQEKYDASTPQRRSVGTNLIINQNADSSYFGTLAIGTPPISYSVILDTGSADLWLAGSSCYMGCNQTVTFNSSASSTFVNQSTPFSVTYGSGKAVGDLAQDVVQMAGFQVTDQTFAICNQVSTGLLIDPVSGLLGLAFQTIASSKAMPFWETLVTEGAWESPLMAFHLTRYINASGAQVEEPGGSFDMGFTNSSLYTGDIDYVNMPSRGTYWLLEMTSVTVEGATIPLPSGSDSYAAIDTGTTLIGGPAVYIAMIFSQIPGAIPGEGNFESYYKYPCDTQVNIQLSFGSKNWTISSDDFELTRLKGGMCLGPFFVVPTTGATPAWIIGDTFLKNVYSVFRYNPPSIGFAQLSESAIAQNGLNLPPPSATIGTPATSVSAAGTSSVGATTVTADSNAALHSSLSFQTSVSVAAVWVMVQLTDFVI
ncbi:aspartic peptidase A1 [Crucibulum laeve]|uniref:Aspartic peptidase A1 n=1 Tax=Crucibulum laeve TaxID=68775 RepID=A0A5C3M3S7_9AGAR|nr:aspartic peptidase A1 [Crucibulum laeve]